MDYFLIQGKDYNQIHHRCHLRYLLFIHIYWSWVSYSVLDNVLNMLIVSRGKSSILSLTLCNQGIGLSRFIVFLQKGRKDVWFRKRMNLWNRYFYSKWTRVHFWRMVHRETFLIPGFFFFFFLCWVIFRNETFGLWIMLL